MAEPSVRQTLGSKTVKGYTLPPEKYRRAVEYSHAWYGLYFARVAYGLAILLLILHFRLGPKYRDWAERVSKERYLQVVVFAPLLLLTLGILGLPTRLYGHWLAVKYGQSVQGWGSWLWDWTKAEALYVFFATLLVWILYGAMRRSPRRWWVLAWLAALPIQIFVVFVAPVVVDPLFFHFEPLVVRQPALAAEIEQVVRRGGLVIPSNHLFEMEAGAKLTSVNAYVTGIGASKRVVVWDTTIARMTRPQILSVFGHEMGHYVLGHVRQGMVWFAAALLVLLYAAHRLLGWLLSRWGARWRIRGADDWASLPVLLLLLAVFSFLSAPVANAISRHVEHQADVYGLEVIHGIVPDSGEVTAQSLQASGEIDLEDPAPPRWIVLWLYTHPPTNERIVFARTYDPWSEGRVPEFVK